jgi:hypothetical protein
LARRHRIPITASTGTANRIPIGAEHCATYEDSLRTRREAIRPLGGRARAV